jgi:stress response protein YsnF
VVAVFRNATDAQGAVNELKSRGFSENNIYVSSGKDTGTDTGRLGTTGAYDDATGDTSMPREGGFTGWLKSLFGGDESHEHYRGYESAYSSGNTVVSVDTDEEHENDVSDVLNRFSPVDVRTDDTGTAEGIRTPNTGNAGYQGSRSDYRNASEELGRPLTTTGSAGVPQPAMAAAEARAQYGSAENQAIPVVEEQIQVGKRAVVRGGVRVFSRVTERPVEEQVRLREEHVRVDRQPVNRPANEADFRTGRDQVIEVQEFAEEAVVSKQARVVEEVRVNKEAAERTETVRDTVRRTDVEVENLDAQDGGRNLRGRTQNVAGQNLDYDDDFRNNFRTTYGSQGLNYDDYAPAYRYGSDMANDPRYQGRNWSDVESDLRSDYGSRYPNSTWEKMKDSIRYGWDKVTGKTRSAASNIAR